MILRVLELQLLEHYTLTTTQLVSITQHTKNLVENCLADSTKEAYKNDWRIFIQWCDAFKEIPFPATPETIAKFLTHQNLNGIAHPTLNRRLAAIKLRHESGGMDSPTKAPLIYKVMRGIKRTNKRVVVKKAPATAERLESMIASCTDSIKGLRDRALLLLGFAGAFRRSELVALTLADIEKTPEGIRVTIRQSKTDQEGKGETIAIPNGTRFRIVDSLYTWLKEADINDGYLFRSILKNARVQEKALSPIDVARIIKRYAFNAGLTVSDFSGHSLRAGFLTSAAKAGASIHKMMETSRHKSIETLAGYVRSENLFENHAGEKFL